LGLILLINFSAVAVSKCILLRMALAGTGRENGSDLPSPFTHTEAKYSIRTLALEPMTKMTFFLLLLAVLIQGKNMKAKRSYL